MAHLVFANRPTRGYARWMPGLGESLVILLILGVVLSPLVVVLVVLRRSRKIRVPPPDGPPR